MKNVKSGHAQPIVCLDAGHYGKYNQSPAVKEYYESDMVWKLHLKLKSYLEQYGIKVITTRSDKDKDLGLTARGKASKGCDLFLSLHSNAVGSGVNESVDYVAVYHLYEDAGTNIDDQSKALAKTLAPAISQLMGVKQSPNVCSRKGSGDWNGDGIMNDNYYSVLNGARLVGTAGLIVEHSFHTNTKATKWLLNDSNLDKMAKVEADIIAEYFDVEMPKADTSNKVIYRVQSGAYLIKANAEKQFNKIKAAGFDAIMVKAGGMYKVQVGAYSVKANAEAQMAKIKKAGFSAFITTQGGEAVSVAPAKKSVDEIAKEVLLGKWGNGTTRKKKLEAAGYNYSEVQKKVNELCK